MRTEKIVIELNPYKDGSGSSETVTIVRTERDDSDAEWNIQLEQGSEAHISLNYDEWQKMATAVNDAITKLSN